MSLEGDVRGYVRMKKIVLFAFTSILLITLIYQGSMAFFRAETQVGTKISAGTLGIQIKQMSDEENAIQKEDGYQFNAAMPGSTLNNSAYIENTKDKTLYVRITAKKYWEDANGHKLNDANHALIELDTVAQDDWIIIDDAENSNAENIYFYYKKPIQAGERSSNLYDYIKIAQEMDDIRYKDYQIRVVLEADAVQSAVAQDAILSEWGMDVTFDEEGNMIAVEE